VSLIFFASVFNCKSTSYKRFTIPAGATTEQSKENQNRLIHKNGRKPVASLKAELGMKCENCRSYTETNPSRSLPYENFPKTSTLANFSFIMGTLDGRPCDPFKNPSFNFSLLPIRVAAFLVGLVNSFAWIWVIVRELKKVVIAINTMWFKIAFWIPCIYIWAFIAFMLFNLFVRKIKSINQKVEGIILIAWAVLSVGCIIYGLVFVGRLIRTAELGKKPTIKEHLI
jgi:hypothetical protein